MNKEEIYFNDGSSINGYYLDIEKPNHCPHCHTKNKKKAKFCEECGKALEEKKKIEEAKRDGKAEGFVVGEKKGKAEGIKKEKQETALKMLQKQMDLKIIKEITGLTEEEIKKLKDKK